MIREDLRNICIIAHVDHGKTTLVDHMLKQSGLFQSHEKMDERVMDSGDLERERGITILAKNTAIRVKDKKFNIVDTPGHSDFGGEVERILGMVDGAVLLVDAAEGALPQTRFVLEKALEKGHKLILVINKVDRQEIAGTDRLEEVVNQIFDLFVELGATEEQCEFPILYAVGRDGWVTSDVNDVAKILAGEKQANLEELYDLVINYLPGPTIEDNEDCRMQLVNLAWSEYVGQLSIGRLVSGSMSRNQEAYCHSVDANGNPVQKKFKVTHCYTYEGLAQKEVDTLEAGEIGIISGCNEVEIGDTIGSTKEIDPFARIKVQVPTIRMIFSINTSPMSGLDGEAIQSRKLKERLERECRANVAIQMTDGDSTDQFFVLGRGELQFAILIEQMRREGLEFMVGRPVVETRIVDGEKQEPVERAVLELPEAHSGEVTEMFQTRKGILANYEATGNERVKLEFDIPSRGLLGIRTHYLTATRGEGLFSSELKGYEPYKGDMLHRKNGALVADRKGKTTEYSLATLEDRGVLFIGPSVEVYEGMVIGECARENDINVNPTKEKKLTNIRTSSSDGITMLSGTRDMNLERCIEWIDDDEWIEVTPSTIRVRKKTLPGNLRSVIRGGRKKDKDK